MRQYYNRTKTPSFSNISSFGISKEKSLNWRITNDVDLTSWAADVKPEKNQTIIVRFLIPVASLVVHTESLQDMPM